MAKPDDCIASTIDPAITLTHRKREILALVAEGFSTKEIAKILGLSWHTVAEHIAVLEHKLNARSQAHMVMLAEHHGFLPIPPPAKLGPTE